MIAIKNNTALKPKGHWSIGTVRSDGLLELQSSVSEKPILTSKQLGSLGGYAAADPFGIFWKNQWYVFFELMLRNSAQACIAVASSRDTQSWEVEGIALQPGHHLSYPFVFEYGGDIYMMPESKRMRRVDLYRAVEFPLRWEFDRTLLRGRYMDASITFRNGRYWMFAGWQSYWLRVFHATSPLGPWRPLLQPFARTYNKSNVRPGGRILEIGGQWIRPAQDNVQWYGHQLRGMKIDQLNRVRYRESACSNDPILFPDATCWKTSGTHHLDLHAHQGTYFGFIDGCT